jgi:geranylgeranyl diphosphate synthase type I
VTTATTGTPHNDTSAQAGALPLLQLEQLLQQTLAERRREAAAIGPAVETAAEELERYVLTGGKRTRPAFVWAGWVAAGGQPDGGVTALQLCAAMELVHASALVHDDVIDRSDTRRGTPTVHIRFHDEHRRLGWAGDPTDYGVAAAILIGDLAAYWADDLVLRAELDSAARRRIAPVWAAMRTEVLGGQLLDIAGEASRDESLDSAMRINHYKTASYTVERPLHLGAALAGADDALIADLRTLGTAVGLAFQLRDDLLGVFGDPAVTGKPSGDDLRTGKRTALVAVALARLDAEDPVAAARLRSALGAPLADPEVETLRTLIAATGAVADIEHRITTLTTTALTLLDRTPTARPHLEPLIHAATSRNS